MEYNIGTILVAKITKKKYIYLGEASDSDYEKFGIKRNPLSSVINLDKDYILMQVDGKEFVFQNISQIKMYFEDKLY